MAWPWRAVAVLLVTTQVVWPRCDVDDVPCTGSFDATFLQINADQKGFDQTRWEQELGIIRDLGVRLIIVQYTGDAHGPYDREGRRPVAALLAAAEKLDLSVMLGLWADPTWPSDRAVRRLAPPLEDANASMALADLCARTSACIGWYISHEIDEETWVERTPAIRQHLASTSQRLRVLSPGKLIAIAPFFVGVLEPADYAHWWLDVLAPGVVDILILQDGVGTGRASPEEAAQYLLALRLALFERGVHVWAVVELFAQQHGAPIDNKPFAATPLEPARFRRSLWIEAAIVERVVAFAVLPYMDPRQGREARRLHSSYAACLPARRPPC